MARREQVGFCLRLIDEAYDGKHPWHGPNLRMSIGGVNPVAADRRPAPGRHSIREIAVHCAYWKYAVRRRITGEKRGSFPLRGSNWFERPGKGKSWKEDVALLEQEHRKLRSVVASLTDSDLRRKAPGAKYAIFRLVMGIAAHDLYHAGQIRLVKRFSSRKR